MGQKDNDTPNKSNEVELDADSYMLYCFLEEYDESISNHEEIRKICKAADKVAHPDDADLVTPHSDVH